MKVTTHMSDELGDYFDAFQNTVRAAASADGHFTERGFVEEMASRLSEAEEIDQLVSVHFEGTGSKKKKLRLDGYDFGDEEGQIVLAVSHYSSGNVIEGLIHTEVTRLFGLVEAFIEQCFDGTLMPSLEPSSDAFQVASEMTSRAGSTHKIRIYLLTNHKLNDSVKNFPPKTVAGVAVEYHIWDIERLRRVESSQLGREEIDIDLREWVSEGVPILQSVSVETGLQTVLAVLPGEMLAGIYGKYGGRVLEANVRSFLTARGNVNRGMKGTIQQEPEMFLAYNNGIAATASAVEIDRSSGYPMLTSVTDLQIVNGGQTTASLFYVQKNDKADLAKISVQMKLIVVGNEESVELVPRISRYANTQNRVSEADFFSNHPFHVRMEEKSRRLLVPIQPGKHFQTKWYYERTRGQYVNEGSRLSVAETRRFGNEYPRGQMVTKTDAAKYLISWAQKPHVVSAGAQKNFIAFASQISDEWKRDDAQFGEKYFQDLISIGLLFNGVRSAVQKSDWYSTGYLANIVTYTLAKLVSSIASQRAGFVLDLGQIWKRQSVPPELMEQILPIARLAFEVLTSEERPVVNVTEWAKREKCWDAVKAAPLALGDGIAAFLVKVEDVREAKSDDRRAQRMDSGISAQIEVMRLGSKYWVGIRDFGRQLGALTAKDMSILQYATGESGKLPSDAQSAYLMQLDARMKSSGFVGK